MESIKSIINSTIKSTYRGSLTTAKMVKEEIAKRWGELEASKYDPYTNCLTFRQWLSHNFRVKRGEHGIASTTIVERKDENGEVIASYPKKVYLFYYLQVEPLTN